MKKLLFLIPLLSFNLSYASNWVECVNTNFPEGIGSTIKFTLEDGVLDGEATFVLHKSSGVLKPTGFFTVGKLTYDENYSPMQYLRWNSGYGTSDYEIPSTIVAYLNKTKKYLTLGFIQRVENKKIEEGHVYSCE